MSCFSITKKVVEPGDLMEVTIGHWALEYSSKDYKSLDLGVVNLIVSCEGCDVVVVANHLGMFICLSTSLKHINEAEI